MIDLDGSGYLKMSNIEQNRAHNFSGRSFSKKTSEELCNDIIQDFNNALNELEDIKKYAFENFCFEKKVDKLIQDLEQKDNVNLDKIKIKYENYSRNLMASKNLLIYANRKAEIIKEREKNQVAFDYIEVQRVKTIEHERENAEYKKDILEYQSKITQLENKIKILDTELLNVKKSKSWKLISKIRNFIKLLNRN